MLGHIPIADAESFNQPLNNWNVSKVKNMGWMFADAEAFMKREAFFIARLRSP